MKLNRKRAIKHINNDHLLLADVTSASRGKRFRNGTKQKKVDYLLLMAVNANALATINKDLNRLRKVFKETFPKHPDR